MISFSRSVVSYIPWWGDAIKVLLPNAASTIPGKGIICNVGREGITIHRFSTVSLTGFELSSMAVTDHAATRLSSISTLSE